MTSANGAAKGAKSGKGPSSDDIEQVRAAMTEIFARKTHKPTWPATTADAKKALAGAKGTPPAVLIKYWEECELAAAKNYGLLVWEGKQLAARRNAAPAVSEPTGTHKNAIFGSGAPLQAQPVDAAQDLAMIIEMLAEFPGHVDAEKMRADVDAAKWNAPDVYERALISLGYTTDADPLARDGMKPPAPHTLIAAEGLSLEGLARLRGYTDPLPDGELRTAMDEFARLQDSVGEILRRPWPAGVVLAIGPQEATAA